VILSQIRKINQLLSLRHFNLIAKELKRISSSMESPVKVLDVGCGNGWYWTTGRLGNLVDSKVIELHILDAAVPPKSLSLISKVHQGIAPETLARFSTNEFDFVTTFDLIEHFPKHLGYQLLYEIDRIASKGSSVFTPNGFVWQPGSENNPFNAHLSGWTSKELSRLGWDKQYSTSGLRLLHGPYGKLKINPVNKLSIGINFLSHVLGIMHKDIGFAVLSIATKKQPREKFQNLGD
jgi:SAM-dependent methyltransferase